MKPRERPILLSLEEGTEKNCQWQLDRRFYFNGCTHTETQDTTTERALQSRFGREKSHQKVPTSTKREG